MRSALGDSISVICYAQRKQGMQYKGGVHSQIHGTDAWPTCYTTGPCRRLRLRGRRTSTSTRARWVQGGDRDQNYPGCREMEYQEKAGYQRRVWQPEIHCSCQFNLPANTSHVQEVRRSQAHIPFTVLLPPKSCALSPHQVADTAHVGLY